MYINKLWLNIPSVLERYMIFISFYVKCSYASFIKSYFYYIITYASKFSDTVHYCLGCNVYNLRCLLSTSTSPNGKTRTFSSNHVFAQIIICGKCGEVFRRVHWNNRGKKSIVWRCVSRLENTGLFCDARTVLESTIEQVLVTAINQTLCDKDSFLTTLRDNIATVINRESDKALADIDKRLEVLQTELLKLATSNADCDNVGDEIHRLRDRKQKLLLENANRDELKKRMADMSTFLKKQSTVLTEYDEQLVRRLIEKVTVYEDKFTVEFKSGLTVDIEE